MTKRRTLDETRTLLLETGARMVREAGATVTIGKFNLVDVCQQAGMTTAGSAYKIWDTQESFRLDLLEHLLEVTFHTDAAVDEVASILTTTDVAPATIQEVIRVVGAQNFAQNAENMSVMTQISLWIAAEYAPDLQQKVTAHEQQSLQAFAELYDATITGFGREWAPPFTAEHLAVALSALVQGLALRLHATPDLVPATVLRPTGPDNAMQEWSLFACGAEALINAYTRPATT